MAHIGEEEGFGAVDLCKRLSAPPFLLKRFCAFQAGGDLSNEELDEAAIVGIEIAVGVEPCHEHAHRLRLPALRNRYDQGITRRFLPYAVLDRSRWLRQRDLRRLAAAQYRFERPRRSAI